VPEQRVMTIEEANALVPRLAELVGELRRSATAIEERLGRLSAARPRAAQPRPSGARLSIEADAADPRDVRDLKRDLRERIAAYEAGWRAVEELGAVVKDPRTGLLDFYGRVEGKLVWLCWRYGEEAISFYHALDAGFSARKPLDVTTRARMLN
jgi:hypothetical protein